ncbi:MAG: rRNA maturation RNase YbeY [Chloroflexi bacterium]|nr:rRNA maturation RNase YbeY [Chloroflexota bacterium]
MTPTIIVYNEAAYTLDENRLHAAAAVVLSRQGAPPEVALSVVIADDDYVAGLNRRFRGVDSPTDVLSFPADAPPVQEEGEPPYLGDLIIAYPYAAAQAAREGHTLDDSLALLVVHGTLHLLGFDHDTPENRAAMWDAQAEALRALGISPDIVPALEGNGHDHLE